MNLLPVANMVRDLAQKKRQEQQLKNYINLLREYKQKINTTFNPTGINNAYWENVSSTTQPNKIQQLTQQPQTPTIKQLPEGDPANYQLAQQLIRQKGEVPPSSIPPKIQMNEQPSDMILGDVKTGTPEQTQQMGKNANMQFIDFLTKGISEGLPNEQLQQGSGLLQKLIQTQQPTIQKPEYKTAGGNLYKIENGKAIQINDAKPEHKNDKLLRNITGEDGFEHFLWQKPTGETYWTKSEQKVRPPKGTGDNKEGNDYNYSNLYANLQEGIKKIKNIRKAYDNPKLQTVDEKTGEKLYRYYNSSKDETELLTEEEFKKEKEKIKTKYVNDAEELVINMGLDGPLDNTPIKNIRAQIDKGYSYKEAIKKFKEANPDFPKDALQIMKEYFELTSM